MKLKIDWYRVLRTAVQAAVGAVAAFCTAMMADFSKEGVVVAGIQCVCTVVTAICMNISKQIDDDDEDDDDDDD